ncbi:MAG: hypothetical protein EOO11_12500, partial [Chitinophagaceae bacterium]
MQFVNDDMDEVFRRAGSDFPLNTGGADWSKVARALELPGEEPAPPRRRRDRRYLWLLLLLLPLPWVCWSDAGDTGNGGSARTADGQRAARVRTGTPITEDSRSNGEAATGPVAVPPAATSRTNDLTTGPAAPSGDRVNTGTGNEPQATAPGTPQR